jgi:hypothetical protein
VDSTRYALTALPAVCLVAASLAAGSGRMGQLGSVAVGVALVLQLWTSSGIRPPGAAGYESAARWLVANTAPSAVLFSGPADSGYFPFFVRKWDPDERFVVLRSDKLLATSLMAWHGLTPQIASPAEIYPILQKFGTRFIVIEDIPSGSKPLEWLRTELKGPHFAERLRFDQRSRDRWLQSSAIVIYEYLEATPPDPDATLDLNLPVVSQRIRMPLRTLLHGDR